MTEADLYCHACQARLRVDPFGFEACEKCRRTLERVCWACMSVKDYQTGGVCRECGGGMSGLEAVEAARTPPAEPDESA